MVLVRSRQAVSAESARAAVMPFGGGDDSAEGRYVLVNGVEAWLGTSDGTTSMLFISTARPGSKNSQWTSVAMSFRVRE